jgi:hypothetical protein
VLANCVPASIRTRGFALSILITHALGDAISPFIIGAISDERSLATAVIIIPITFAVGAAIWIFAWRYLPPLSTDQGDSTAHHHEHESTKDLLPRSPRDGADVILSRPNLTPVNTVHSVPVVTELTSLDDHADRVLGATSANNENDEGSDSDMEAVPPQRMSVI